MTKDKLKTNNYYINCNRIQWPTAGALAAQPHAALRYDRMKNKFAGPYRMQRLACRKIKVCLYILDVRCSAFRK